MQNYFRREFIFAKNYRQIVVSDLQRTPIDGHFDDCTKEVLKGLEDGDNDTDDEVQSNIVKFVC